MWQSKDNLERSFELIWDDDRLENSRNFSQYYAFLDTKKDSNFHPINLTFGLVCNSLIYFGASSNFSNFEQANEIFVKIKQKMKARKGAISLKEENSTYIECDFGDVNEIGSLRIVGNKYFFSYSLYVKEYEHLVQ